jgi:hypothetical protein
VVLAESLPEPAAAIVTEKGPLAVSGTGVVESVTVKVKLNVPAVVGVPEMVPVELSMVSPGGSDPLAIDQLYGGVPPVTATVAEYGTPTVPLGREVVVMSPLEPPAETTIERSAVAVRAVGVVESVTVTVKSEVPAAVGVPEMAPLEASRLSPAESDPVVTVQV